MITEIFKAVLVMSGASSCAAVLLFALRRMSGRFFGHNIRYRAWLAVLLIAVIPLSLRAQTNSSEASVIVQNFSTVQQKLTHIAPMQSATEATGIASSAVDLSVWNIAALIWLIAAFGKLVALVCNYFRFLTKTFAVANFSHKIGKISVYEADILPAPIAVGVFKKRIILPPGISDDKRNIVEMHECMHFKHNDILFKWIAAVVGCVHWFNPLFWYVSKAIDEDCEIYCDMAVCGSMSDSEKKHYMDTILSLITSASGCTVYTAMANSKQNIIRRFSYITNSDGKTGFVRSFTGVAVLAVVFVFAAILSGIAGARVYDGSFPTIRLSFSSANTHTPQKTLPSDRTETDNAILFSDNKESSINKEDVSDIRDGVSLVNQNNISYEHTSEAGHMPENNTNKDYQLSVPTQHKTTAPKASEKETVLNSVNTETSDNSSNVFSQKGEEEKIKSDYESDEFRYPYSGSVKYDGLTLDAIEHDIEQNGGRKSSTDGVDLKNGYISDKLTYLNGGVAQIKNVTTDSNGQVSFYMNSEYDQHIEVSIEQNGKQVAGYGIIPDNETTYVFGGLNPDETYDITISSSTGGSWKVENDYILY